MSSDDEQIIPSWAFILISFYLSSCCLNHVYGDLKNLDEKLYLQKIDSIDFSMYKNKKVIAKNKLACAPNRKCPIALDSESKVPINIFPGVAFSPNNFSTIEIVRFV